MPWMWASPRVICVSCAPLQILAFSDRRGVTLGSGRGPPAQAIMRRFGCVVCIITIHRLNAVKSETGATVGGPWLAKRVAVLVQETGCMEVTVMFNHGKFTPSLRLLSRGSGDRYGKLRSSVWSVTVVYLGGLRSAKSAAALEGETGCMTFTAII